MEQIGPGKPPGTRKPQLTKQQNMEVAHLGAAAERRAFGNLAGQDDEQSLRELLEISRDPIVWGVMLGDELADLELRLGSLKARIVDWARQVGADEETARQQLAWRLAQPLNMRPD